jgi:hypothetical protein
MVTRPPLFSATVLDVRAVDMSGVRTSRAGVSTESTARLERRGPPVRVFLMIVTQEVKIQTDPPPIILEPASKYRSVL